MQEYVLLEPKHSEGFHTIAYIDDTIICEQVFVGKNSDENESFSSFMVRVLNIMKNKNFEYYDQFNSGRVLVFKKED